MVCAAWKTRNWSAVSDVSRSRSPSARCPTWLEDHPLPKLIDAGLLVTINSDDPAYFGGYVGDNYTAVAEAFGWDLSRMSELASNSLEAAFVDGHGA